MLGRRHGQLGRHGAAMTEEEAAARGRPPCGVNRREGGREDGRGGGDKGGAGCRASTSLVIWQKRNWEDVRWQREDDVPSRI